MELKHGTKFGQWTGAQIQTFLAETCVPLRLSVVTDSGPVIVPVWFEFKDNCFWSCSPSSSLLVRALAERAEVAFDVSTNDIPYQGVRGRGRAFCTVAPDKAALEALLQRYLGGVSNDLSKWLLSRSSEEAIIRIEMTWLTSWDFSERMQSIQKISARGEGARL